MSFRRVGLGSGGGNPWRGDDGRRRECAGKRCSGAGEDSAFDHAGEKSVVLDWLPVRASPGTRLSNRPEHLALRCRGGKRLLVRRGVGGSGFYKGGWGSMRNGFGREDAARGRNEKPPGLRQAGGWERATCRPMPPQAERRRRMKSRAGARAARNSVDGSGMASAIWNPPRCRPPLLGSMLITTSPERPLNLT